MMNLSAVFAPAIALAFLLPSFSRAEVPVRAEEAKLTAEELNAVMGLYSWRLTPPDGANRIYVRQHFLTPGEKPNESAKGDGHVLEMDAAKEVTITCRFDDTGKFTYVILPGRLRNSKPYAPDYAMLPHKILSVPETKGDWTILYQRIFLRKEKEAARFAMSVRFAKE